MLGNLANRNNYSYTDEQVARIFEVIQGSIVVMEFLNSQGVKPDLISAQGFGDGNPVASNDTAQGRAQNRRVELSVAGSGC